MEDTKIGDRQPTISKKLTTDKALVYLNEMKLPNIHVGIYHPLSFEEFSLLYAINVLIGEDKHRLFKLLIYLTNHHHVEKELLDRENIRQTIRFTLQNAYSETKADRSITTLL